MRQEEKPGAQPGESSSNEPPSSGRAEEDAFLSTHPSPPYKGDTVWGHPEHASFREEAAASPLSMADARETDSVATTVEAKEPQRKETKEAEAACSQHVPEGERHAAAALVRRITLRVALKLEGGQRSSNSQESDKSDADQEAAAVLEFTGTPVNLGAWEDDYVDDFEDELVRAASTPVPGEVKEYMAKKVEDDTVEESGPVPCDFRLSRCLKMLAFQACSPVSP